MKLSPQAVEAIALVVSGGPGGASQPPVGIYRTATQLEQFMRGCGVQMQIGARSRYPALMDALFSALEQPDADAVLTRIIEHAADPRDSLDDPERHAVVVSYLNERLIPDGILLQPHGSGVRLVDAGRSAMVTGALARKAETISFDTVARDLHRALDSATDDPEDAVTAACSVLESLPIHPGGTR